MVSTGLSIYEFMNGKRRVSVGDICEYIEIHAANIIASTIEDLNRSQEPLDPTLPDGDDIF